MLKMTMQVTMLETTLETEKTLLKEKIKIILLKPGKKPLLLGAQLTKMPLLGMPPPEWVMMQKILKKSKSKMRNRSQKKESANAQQKLKKFEQKK